MRAEFLPTPTSPNGFLDESNNHQLTKVGGCMASAQPVS